MFSPIKNTTGCVLLLAALAVGSNANAQGVFVSWTAGDANYNDDNTSVWDTGNVPWTDFDEVANISNGGVAHVDTVLTFDPGQLVLGELAGQTGTLSIENGGSTTLTFVDGNQSTAGVDVGLAGSGTLNVLPGGSLTAAYLTLGGEGGSVVSLGGQGSGTTNLSIGLAGILGQFGTTVGAGNTLRVTGPNVDYTTLSFQVNGGGALIADITSDTHSPIKSVNAAVAGGTLRVEFAEGVSPSAGDSWDLFDTPSINGQFDAIDTSAAPELPLGQSYTFKAVADPTSVNGVVGRLGVEQQLLLSVNRNSGQVAIVTGPAAVDIDGYSISSQLGGLNAGNWDSLADQAVSDWRESPAGGSDTRLSELKPTDSTSVTSGAGLQLGDVFQYPVATEFGTELEDIAFEYYTPDGQTVQATVVYEGDKRFNNLVLMVDPDDGAAQLVNQSDVAVSIDGYKISSDSGSLLPGDWLSLEDQGAESGAWYESNPTGNNLIELRPDGETLLAGGATFDLGGLFQAGGTADLTLQYLFPEDAQFTRFGEVVYRDLDNSAVVGDYTGDGVVDAADYTAWRDTLGDSVSPGSGADGDNDGVIGSGDYQVWVGNFGATGASAGAGAVPEPVALSLVVCLLGAGLVGPRRTARATGVAA